MTVLDVLLNADAGEEGPADWPARVAEREDDAPLPAAPWLRMTVAEYEAYRTERLPAWEAWRTALPPPPPPVPQEVTNAQARAVLLALPPVGEGPTLFDDIDAALRAGKDGGFEARMAWQFWEQANTFARNGALVNQLGSQFGLSQETLDDLFRQAATIEA